MISTSTLKNNKAERTQGNGSLGRSQDNTCHTGEDVNGIQQTGGLGNSRRKHLSEFEFGPGLMISRSNKGVYLIFLLPKNVKDPFVVEVPCLDFQ